MNLLFIIYASSRPQIRLEELTVGSQRILLVEPDRSLSFSAAEYLKLKIMKKALDLPDVNIIVLNGQYVKTIDVTLAEVCKIDSMNHRKSNRYRTHRMTKRF